jgi:hypothetical protein
LKLPFRLIFQPKTYFYHFLSHNVNAKLQDYPSLLVGKKNPPGPSLSRRPPSHTHRPPSHARRPRRPTLARRWRRPSLPAPATLPLPPSPCDAALLVEDLPPRFSGGHPRADPRLGAAGPPVAHLPLMCPPPTVYCPDWHP